MSTDTTNPCGYCKTRNSTSLYPTSDIFGDKWTINSCKECDAQFLAPTPTNEQLARAYDGSYYGEGEEKFEGLVEKVLDKFRNARARRLAKYLNGSGTVLDIGCGNGRFLQSLGQHGNFKLHGIEMPGGSAERAKRIAEINLKIGVLEATDFQPESMDAITLFHVFEHLTEPMEYLDIISSILKPGGILMMSFPNIDSFQSGFFKGSWLHLDPPRHLFFFSPKAFKKHMADYGFEVIREKHFNIEYNPFGTQQSWLNLICKKREVLYEHLKGNKDYVKEYSRLNLGLQNLWFKLSFPSFVLLDAWEALFRKGGTVEFVLRKKT